MAKLRSFGLSCLVMITIALITGCSGSTTTPPPSGPALMYVADNGISAAPGANLVAEFKLTDTGNAAPQRVIQGALTGLISPKAIARDAAGNIYVGQNDEETGACPPTVNTGSIVVYGPTASGNIAPLRTIAGTSTTLDDSINGIAVDAAGNIYVTQDDNINDADLCAPLASHARLVVFGPSANGNVAPTAAITGPLTTLLEPNGLFADNAGHIWVAEGDNKTVLEFPVIGSGTGNINEAPTSTLNPAIFATANPSGIALDEAGHIYVSDSGDNGVPAIYIFPAGASGATAPTATITGAATLMQSPNGIRVSGGFIYVADASAGTPGSDVLVFKTTDTGNAAPSQQIKGVTTLLTEPQAVSL